MCQSFCSSIIVVVTDAVIKFSIKTLKLPFKAGVSYVWKSSYKASLLHPRLLVFAAVSVLFSQLTLSFLIPVSNCSSVNWSVSARLKPTDVANCNSAF